MEIALLTSRYIAQVLILGDNQPYTGALIVPDFEELGHWAAGNGIAEMPPEQLVEERAVQKLIEGEVSRQARGLRHLRAPATRCAAPAVAHEEEGELTPSLKVKARVVKERWAAKIGYLFDGAATPATDGRPGGRCDGSPRRYRRGRSTIAA